VGDKGIDAKFCVISGGFERLAKTGAGDACVDEGAFASRLDGTGDEHVPIIWVNRRGLAGGAQGEDSVAAAANQMLDDAIHGRLVDSALGRERADHRDDQTAI
jgi:hypothetical protein